MLIWWKRYLKHKIHNMYSTIFQYQTARYLVNGIIASLIHYFFLLFCLEVLKINSAGLSNFFSSVFGITSSFLGNRYYVFDNYKTSVLSQLKKFLPLYYILSIVQGGILYFFFFLLNYNYNIGFAICILFQVIIGFLGGKYFVFNTNK